MEAKHELMQGPTTKVSKFRLSGWKDNTTGIVTEFFGNDQPSPDSMVGSSFLYDIMIEKTSVTTPYVAPLAPQAAE